MALFGAIYAIEPITDRPVPIETCSTDTDCEARFGDDTPSTFDERWMPLQASDDDDDSEDEADLREALERKANELRSDTTRAPRD